MIMKNDDPVVIREMERLIDEAVRNVAAGGGPFAAVVMRGEEVVGRGVNAVHASHDPTAHAEIVAIRAACEHLATHDLNDCRILTSCYPCPMCLGAILWSRIGSIFYAASTNAAASAGFDDDTFYRLLGVEAGASLPPSGILTIAHLDLPNARSPFDAWIDTPEAPRY